MNRNTGKILCRCLCLCCILLAGCVKEPEPGAGYVGEGEVWATLDFGHTSFDKVQITTRATLGEVPESRVRNLYVYIFDDKGERLYGRFFDNGNHETTLSGQHDHDCWTVTNKASENNDNDKTRGTVRMKVPTLGGGRIRILANIDADIINLSPEKLNLVHSLADLDALQATLNQEITSRNGNFPMTGKADNVTIASDGTITAAGGGKLTIPLARLDAKVEVKVRVAENYQSQIGDTTQKLESFIPESWQVMRLPRGCFLMERDATGENHDATEPGYFDSGAIPFETAATEDFTYTGANGQSIPVKGGEVHGFSFYMLENRPKMKQSVGGEFHKRDTRRKHDDGTYDTSNGLWEYAPETGTYLVVRGEVKMKVSSGNVHDQMLSAQVTYYIHLGNFKDDRDDYRIERNTHYTYTITIKGVNSIQVEVNEKRENESGATGHIYIAHEAIHTFDAHYGQRVFAFDATAVEPDKVTWYVSTPFGREGMPERVGGTEVPSGLDYEWVEFMIHKTPPVGQQYSHNNCAYHPDETMNVIEFCDYIREQTRRYNTGQPNDFREEEGRPLIYATVFVNEFYYDEDPISHQKRPGLWKEFVNRPNRIMHILCETNFSPDGASSATGSVITVCQRSIQTVYNIDNPSLATAWGSEVTDEMEGELWFYHRQESHDRLPVTVTDAHNDSPSNGLYNTLKLWGIKPGESKWEEFLDYDRPNDHDLLFLKDDDNHATSRYAILMRNRDNDGDGIIDADELRWYIASIQQLSGLYVGDQGLSGDAQLYDQRKQYGKDEQDNFDGYKWRNHVISSTKSATTNLPVMVWAEEGFSTSDYRAYADSKPGHYSVRCVRNLGMDPASEEEARRKIEEIGNIPERSIEFGVSGTGADAVYRFDLTKVNSKSLRYYTSHDLVPTDEHSEAARPYAVFETGVAVEFPGTYQDLKAMLDRGESPCPAGYRVPNIREAALMSIYIDNEQWWEDGSADRLAFVGGYYSFGQLGKQYDNGCYSWYFRNGLITIGPNTSPQPSYIRCVRDVR